tara:strand:+ start:314 stop:496 length:183 start_codon:yes stop_codon:yes gene_type:complete
MKLKEALELLVTCIYPDHLDDPKVLEAIKAVKEYSDKLEHKYDYSRASFSEIFEDLRNKK